MYLRELTLRNVRQFKDRTFTFQPGFNLLVGENGAGKTTVLRSVLAVFIRATRKRLRLPLTDDDIRLRTQELNVSAIVASSDKDEISYATYSRRIDRRASRTNSGPSPLVMWYPSNEATCGSFAARRVRQFTGDIVRNTPSDEEWLYQQQELQTQAQRLEPSFGRSENVREFVLRILFTFSERFQDFEWSFEPFDCSIRRLQSEANNGELDPGLRKSLQNAVMRYLLEANNPLSGIDSPSVTIDSKGFIIGFKHSRPITPSFRELLARMEFDFKEISLIDQCTAEIRLSPRIRIIDQEGDNFLLSQLSDGEQRLFSLFVDIARQLRLESPTSPDFYNTSAIVLIDEVDVHLHPRWQRMVVGALEKLFSACQFIATTHSPFVIQTLRPGKLILLDDEIQAEYSDQSIEDISEGVMGIELPQKSERYVRMLKAAEEYFKLLRSAAAMTDAGAINAAKAKLDELSIPFSDDPAYQAFLKVERIAALGEDANATN